MDNKIEKTKSADTTITRDLNNFYHNFPRGQYRDARITVTKRKQKLMADLDKTATDLGINTEFLFEEIERANSRIMEGVRLMQREGDSPKAREIAGEGKLIKLEAEKKLLPLFQAMVQLGYSPEELIS